MPAEMNNKYALKYKDEYADSLYKYTDECVKIGKYPQIEDWLRDKDIEISSSTTRNWCDPKSPYYHERFGIAYVRMIDTARSMLVDGALTERYNAQFAKFLASACYGMREQTAVDIGGARGDQEPLSVEIKIIGDK